MTLPAYARLLGATLGHDAEGAPVLTMPFADDVLGRPGFLHGGAIAGLLEVAGRVALDHALGDDRVGVEPVTITTDYHRGGRDRDSHAAGIVTRLGTRIASVEATIWQDDRANPIATARLTYRLKRDVTPAAGSAG